VEQPLGHVSGIDHDQLERSPAFSPRQSKPAQPEAPGHSTRRAHDHDDTESQPDGDARSRSRTAAEQHDRIVVSRLRVRRHLRYDEESRGSVRGQREVRRTQRQPP
jgi:hypothetical protein